MAKSKKKKLIKWVSIGVAVVIVVAGGITVLANSKNSSDSTTTLTKATVQSTTLKKTVSGSGSVSNADEYALTAPGSGAIDALNVKQGDTVKAGDVIAHINGTSAANTVLQKQSALDNAKNNLTTAQNQLNSLYVKAPVAGRVKSIVPAVGDSTSDVKAISNTLAVISTARAMTVSISSPQQPVSVGGTVAVYDESGALIANGTVISGSAVSSGAGGGNQSAMTVQIDTDTPAVSAPATVKTSDGALIGTGKLQLVSSVNVSSQIDGTFSNVYVSENQMVNKRDNLFRLDSTSVNNQITQAQKAEKLAEDDLANANAAMDELTIKSPIDGTIAQLSVKLGDNVNNGGAIATIINPTLMQTVVSVDELDISSVKIGLPASITLDALTKTFTGSVTAINEIGSTTNGVATYSVTVSIDNPENVKVGMTTNAAITTSSTPNVIVVPTAAVLKKSGTTGYVLSSDILGADEKSKVLNNANIDDLVAKYGKKVTIGSTTSNEYQITEGLNVGDSYVVAVTISKSAVKSLSNTTSTANNGFGGMGGMQGIPGGYTRQNGGTGTRASGNTGTGNTGNRG